MVRQQRTRSPQRWTAAHLRLADTHAAWRTDAEQGLAESKRWADPLWRRHRLDETYHRLCANPAVHLAAALEQAVQAAGQETAILRQWTDTLGQAARDTAEPTLQSWADRLQNAVAEDEPALAALTALLAHGQLGSTARAWAHTYRGQCLCLADLDDESIAELGRAIAVDSSNARAWAFRGEAHRCRGNNEQAVSDLTTALSLDPADVWALAGRGEAHRMAGHHDQAVADLTSALDLEPDDAWALAYRGAAHRMTGRYDQALTDLTAALDIQPDYARAFTQRGLVHLQTGRYDEAVADFSASLGLKADNPWVLCQRGVARRAAGQFSSAQEDIADAADQDAITDLLLYLAELSALDHAPTADRAQQCSRLIRERTSR
ncbi:tetratricopeptide repeat protein [Streptomyces sp. NPDC059866]|uniref:tetratricopeptide repeat protein n=1 Tax=Streptomyces sp. NPDC059866 TaxID=3346978 RepID=UPI003648DE0B